MFIFFKFFFLFYFLFLHKKYQGRPHFARVGGIPETRVLFCLALSHLYPLPRPPKNKKRSCNVEKY